MKIASIIILAIWIAAMWAADHILPPAKKDPGVQIEFVNLPKFR